MEAPCLVLVGDSGQVMDLVCFEHPLQMRTKECLMFMFHVKHLPKTRVPLISGRSLFDREDNDMTVRP